MATRIALDNFFGSYSMKQIRANWSLVFALGVMLMILGLVSIAAPLVATLAVSSFIGWMFVFSAVFEILHAFKQKGNWRILGYFALGTVYGIAGFGLLSSPLRGALTLTFFLGVLFLISGTLKAIMAITERTLGAKYGFLLFSAIVTFALGIVLLSNLPGTATWAIGMIVGIEFFFTGMSMIALATTAKGLKKFDERTFLR
jgi:uncharacterized membrane protein HdeD (DUF308 family)